MDEEVTDEALRALIDEARAKEAARERGRRRWLTQAAGEGARLAGVLLDAAERGHGVTLRTVHGSGHRGAVLAVGADFCRIATTARAEVYVVLDAITVVRPDPALRSVPADSDRRPTLDLTLAEVLGRQVDERPRVRLLCAGDPDAVVGTLVSVGADVVTLGLDTAGALAYVSLLALVEVAVLHGG